MDTVGMGWGKVALVLALLAGCSSPRASQTAPLNAPVSTAACPAPSLARPAYPAGIPADFPSPPSAVLASQEVRQGVTYVHFSTSSSLREGVIYLVTALRKAGYVLGRGDAERNEADAPFTGPAVVGALRLTRVATCETSWTLAIAPRASLLDSGTFIPHSPGPSPSPLPFG